MPLKTVLANPVTYMRPDLQKPGTIPQATHTHTQTDMCGYMIRVAKTNHMPKSRPLTLYDSVALHELLVCSTCVVIVSDRDVFVLIVSTDSMIRGRVRH